MGKGKAIAGGVSAVITAIVGISLISYGLGGSSTFENVQTISPNTDQTSNAPVVSTQETPKQQADYRCFSSITEVRNVVESSDGLDWESVLVWQERPESFCEGSLQGTQYLDLSRMEDYAYGDGNPRYTEFKFLNGTTIALNEDHVVRYQS